MCQRPSLRRRHRQFLSTSRLNRIHLSSIAVRSCRNSRRSFVVWHFTCIVWRQFSRVLFASFLDRHEFVFVDHQSTNPVSRLHPRPVLLLPFLIRRLPVPDPCRCSVSSNHEHVPQFLTSSTSFLMSRACVGITPHTQMLAFRSTRLVMRPRISPISFLCTPVGLDAHMNAVLPRFVLCRLSFSCDHDGSSRCRRTRLPRLSGNCSSRMLCWLLQSSLHQSLVCVPWHGQGGDALMSNDVVTPSSILSVGFGQFNCGRLCCRDGVVHDDFMGLVSYLIRLSLRVVCVQDPLSPTMVTLAIDQSLWNDSPLDSYGREADFLFHFAIDSISNADVEDSQSLRLRLNTGVVYVFFLYVSYVGIVLCACGILTSLDSFRTACLVISVLLLYSYDWRFQYLVSSFLGRSWLGDRTILPSVDRLMESHTLELRNPLNQATHRYDVVLDIIRTTSTFRCQVIVHHDSNYCAVASLRCLLLASFHLLCSYLVNIPQVPLTATVDPSRLSRVCDWSAFLTSCQSCLIVWHHLILKVSTEHHPDIPGRVSILDSLFAFLSQIISDGTSLDSRPRPNGNRAHSDNLCRATPSAFILWLLATALDVTSVV